MKEKFTLEGRVAGRNKPFIFFNDLDIYRHKNWFLGIGIFLMLLGILAIGYAKWASEFTVILLGFLLLGSGLVQIISSPKYVKWTGYLFSLFIGLLYIIGGIVCILKPMQSAEAISLFIAALLIAGGIFRLITAIYFRFNRWGWVVFNGIAATILGLLILLQWPASGLWVIGLFVGIDLILIGYYWVSLALAARKMH